MLICVDFVCAGPAAAADSAQTQTSNAKPVISPYDTLLPFPFLVLRTLLTPIILSGPNS